jgi:hypothetical protein
VSFGGELRQQYEFLNHDLWGAARPDDHGYSLQRLRRRGAELRLVIHDAHAARAEVDTTLLKALGRARRWFDQLVSGEATSLTAIAQREGLGVRYVGRLLPLAFLAPPIVEIIAQGHQPVEVTTEMLTRRTILRREWQAQLNALGLVTAYPCIRPILESRVRERWANSISAQSDQHLSGLPRQGSRLKGGRNK